MVNIDNENDENIVLDIDNDSIVSDPVAPETSLMEGTLERPIEVPAGLVRDNIQEASEADSGRSSTRPRTATASAGPSRGMRKTRQRERGEVAQPA